MKNPGFKSALTVMLLITFVCLGRVPLNACIWIYGTNIEGKTIELNMRPADSAMRNLDPVEIKKMWQEKLKEFEAAVKPDSDYKLRSDYAAALIHVGQNKKAIEILEDVEKTNPGLYITASNLGTAYELDGENEKALEWIKKGIDRNSQSHFGTEWVHVKILETKLELAKDPNWLKTHTVLGLNFGNEKRPLMAGIPTKDHLGKEYNAEEAAYAVEYQLHERLAFVSPPDPIVADLLFDLGNVYALTKSLEHALPVYDMALKFNHPRPEFAKARRDFVAGVLATSEKPIDRHLGPNTERALAIVLSGIAFAFLLIFVKRRFRRA